MPRERIPTTEDFSVNVQIMIDQDSSRSGYTARIKPGGSNWYNFHIGLKEGDVEEINSELQQAIEDVSGCFIEKGKIDEDTFDEKFNDLARKGKWAFNRIFRQGDTREFISGALKEPATIQFSSPDFFIPWELLYDGPDDVDVTQFWGMRHIVSRALIMDTRPGDYVPPEMQASCPHVGLIAYSGSGLENITEQEIPALELLHKKKQIYLTRLRELKPDKRYSELKELHTFLGENMQIAHVASHAIVNKKEISQSYLLISDEFPITIQDFDREEFNIKHKPLVILNACLTGIISPRHTCNWVIKFSERGARGVLATEFHVPDWFAADFIKELYNNILSGAPIGNALIDTRRLFFWEEKKPEHTSRQVFRSGKKRNRNPLGLAYALYSSPSIRIKN